MRQTQSISEPLLQPVGGQDSFMLLACAVVEQQVKVVGKRSRLSTRRLLPSAMNPQVVLVGCY
jgi:hypothetical protein